MSDDIVEKMKSQIGDDVRKIYDREALYREGIREIERLRAERDAAWNEAIKAAAVMLEVRWPHIATPEMRDDILSLLREEKP